MSQFYKWASNYGTIAYPYKAHTSMQLNEPHQTYSAHTNMDNTLSKLLAKYKTTNTNFIHSAFSMHLPKKIQSNFITTNRISAIKSIKDLKIHRTACNSTLSDKYTYMKG